MLERTHFAYAPGARLCALATGPETIKLWRFDPDEIDPSEGESGASRPADLVLETSRSRIEGIAFTDDDRLLTVHQLGETVIWELPEIERATPEVPAKTDDASTEAEASEEDQTQTDDEEAKDVDLEADEESLPAQTDSQTPAAEPIWEGDVPMEPCIFARSTDARGIAATMAVGGRRGRVALLTSGGEDEALQIVVSEGHQTDVTTLEFSHSGDRLVSGGRDRQIAVWSTDEESFYVPETDESAEQKDEAPETDTAKSNAPAADEIDLSEEDLGSASDVDPDEISASVRQLPDDQPRLERTALLEGSQGWPLTAEFSHDDRWLASTSLDNALYLWEPTAEEPLKGVINRHHNWVTDLTWSQDDSRLATGSWDTSINVFETEGLEPTFRFEAHTDFVSGLAFLEDGRRLVSVGYDGQIAIWDWQNGELIETIKAHSDWIEELHVVDDSRIFTISSEDVIRFWDLDDSRRLVQLGDAGFEGFDLGRTVDFSDYVEVPDLASDSMEGAARRGPALETVHRFSDESPLEQDEGAAQTAVGLLESAIDTSTGDTARNFALDGQAPTNDENESANLLESQLDQRDDGPALTGDLGADAAPEDKEAGEEREATRSDEAPDEPASILETSDADIDAAFDDISNPKLDDGASSPLDEQAEEATADGSDAADEAETSPDEGAAPGEEDASAEEPPDDDAAADWPEDAGSESASEDEPGSTFQSTGPTPKLGGKDPSDPEPEETSAESLGGGTEAMSASTLHNESSPRLGQPADDETADDDSGDPAEETLLSPPRSEAMDDESTGAGAARSNTGRDKAEFDKEDEGHQTLNRLKPGNSTPVEDESGESDDESSDDTSLGAGIVRPSAVTSSGDDTTSAQDDGEESEFDERPESAAKDLKSRFRKLRQKKREKEEQGDASDDSDDEAPADDEPRADVYDTSASEIWEHRPNPTNSVGPEASEPRDDDDAPATYQLRHTFPTGHNHVYGVAPQWDSDLLASCGGDGSAKLWSLGGRSTLTLPTDHNELNDLTLTPDGRVLIAASDDTRVHLWLLPEDPNDASARSVRHAKLNEHTDWVTSVDVDDTGKHLLTGSYDGTARIWSLVDGACMAVLEGHDGPVLDVSWGQFPVTAGQDGSVRYWDAEGRNINEMSGYGVVTSVATKGTETCWTTESGKVFRQGASSPTELRSHKKAARAAAFGTSGTLVTAGEDRRLYVYPPDSTEASQMLRADAAIWCLFVGGNLMGAGGDDGRVYLFGRN